jgi:predicted regulator of Ras-like GTPase activity (Roadblock/LC7/MglB family)
MRPGVASYTSERDDRAFMEVGPHLMSGIAERLTSTGAGKLQSLIINLEKDSVLLIQVGDGHLAISADRSDAPNVFREIEPMIRQL